MSDLKADIEALIFQAGEEGILLSEIASAAEKDPKECMKEIKELEDDLRAPGRGITLKKIGERYTFATAERSYQAVANAVEKPERFKFTDSIMEVIAIVAYKQPVSRAEIEEIRGVSCGNIINKLLNYGIIEEKGRLESPGRPILFGTGSKFLRMFNLNDLSDLPAISDIESEKLMRDAKNPDEPEEEIKGKLIFDISDFENDNLSKNSE